MAGRISPPSEAPDGSGSRFAIVAARFHEAITTRLVEGALDCLERHGARDVSVDWVPGSFELPLAARAHARSGANAVVALGCVVRGDTPHFDYVCAEAARGILQVSLETDVPVSFGVLTCDTMEQAEARAGGSAGNKGWDAAMTALEMAQLLARFRMAEDAPR